MSTPETTEFFPIVADRPLETERYEFRAPHPYRFHLDRRQFFKRAGSGMVVLFLVEAALAQQQQLETGVATRRGGRGAGVPADIGAWLHIAEDGTITVFTGKAEVGQNIRTSLAQAVAEELRTPVSSIKMVMADTDLTPFDAGTFGSQSTPQMASRLHRVAAAAREALVNMAAETLKADRASLTVADGKISKNGTKESVTFGQLTKGQKMVKTVDNNTPTTAPKDWKIAGTSVPKVNGRDFVTGKHKYASDMKLPGMLQGKMLRPPVYGATLVEGSLDTKAAEAIPGVMVVHDNDFVGVAAPDTMIAQQAIDAIKAEWTKPEPKTSSIEIYDYLKKNATAGGGGRRGGGGGGGGNAGTIDEALAQADHKFEQTYHIAYIAHVPLEPRAALAEWKDDKMTVWTGTQSPFGVQGSVAGALKIPQEKVRVIVPDTGSGYGGKHQERTAIEAARLAKGVGRPVKLVFTRQEEFCWAYVRPAGVIEVKSGVKNDGTITAWEFHNYYSGGSGIDSPYDIPGKRSVSHGLAQGAAPLEVGSYRGLAATANHFAREVHMDELARAVKLDPLEFRLKNCKEPRLRAVLEAAAKTFGWGKEKATDVRGFGLAGGTEKGSYVATCVEVAIDRDSGGVKLKRAVTAFECGAIVNPDHLKNQVEGAVVMGIGGALFEAVEFKDGMITNPLLSDYRVPRFSDMPKLEVVLLDRKDIPSAGAGETPIVCIAPAIGNAVCDATGIRLRAMPMVPEGLNLAEAKKG